MRQTKAQPLISPLCSDNNTTNSKVSRSSGEQASAKNNNSKRKDF
jgi:hypothetical protein